MPNCSRCGTNNIQKVVLTKSLLINPSSEIASVPNIFPLNISYCTACGYVREAYVPGSSQHTGQFTYKDVADNAYPPHYHKSGWHFEYVTKGSFTYYQRPVGSTATPTPITISEGQLYFSRAEVEHGFIFANKTGLISLINTGRPDNDFTVVTGQFYDFVPITKR